MNVIPGFYPDSTWWTFAISIAIQITAISGLALAAISLAGRRRPALRHAIGLTALMVVMLAPFIAWSARQTGMAPIPAPFPETSVGAAGTDRAMELNNVPLDLKWSGKGDEQSLRKIAAAPELPGASVILNRRAASAHRVWPAGIFILTWLAGVGALFVRLIYGLGYQQACCRRARPLDIGAYRKVIQNTALILGQSPPPILLSRLLDLPLVAGWRRPRVLLPEGLPERVNARQLECILLHECAHIARGDHWVGLIQRAAEMIFWFHPFIHKLNRQIGRAREEVCDNYALQQGRVEDYARTLLQVAEHIPRYSHVPATSGLIGPKWKLEERIEGILDKRRQIMTHINRLAVGFTAVFFIGIAVLSSVQAGNENDQAAAADSSKSSRHNVATVMARFTEYKIRQMDQLAAKQNFRVPDEYQRFIKTIQANASLGEVADQLRKADRQSAPPLRSGPVLELYGAYEQVKTWEPELLKLYADLMLTNLPAGSILMGGTDPGRFVTTMFRYGQGSPDIYIITQNALADDSYVNYIRAIYGQVIQLPTQSDANKAFQACCDKIKSGELPNTWGVVTNGRASISGVAGVMWINGMLARQIYDANKQERPIFIEESYVIDWMYPYLAPYGVIMRLMPDKVTLTDEMIAGDTRYWDFLCRELLGRADFGKDVMAKKSFAKLRCAQAGIYAFHRRYDLAEIAFKQALDLWSMSDEATFRLADCYLKQGKKQEARDVCERYLMLDPDNNKVRDFVKQIQ